MVKLVVQKTGRILADRLEVARTTRERMRGLLGRDALASGGGMLIERCSSIHTFFMRFPLDVVFLDADMSVRKIVKNLRPWRLASAAGASHVVELPAGVLDDVVLECGDVLLIEEWV